MVGSRSESTGAPGRAQRPIPLHHGDAELGIGSGWQIAEAAMRSDGVVVVLPGGEHRTGMSERVEQGLVQELISEPAIEALHEGILGGLGLVRCSAIRYGSPATSAGSPCW